MIRMLTALLDEHCRTSRAARSATTRISPICRRCRDLIAEMGDETPIALPHARQRYVEKLATPDVTIADMIGDIDPIKAARARPRTSRDELTVHYGLLPRANRGIFAINELPDLAGKIQVGLFNIMQEGDVQIKGYPVRLPLDVMLVFTANPEDYTARGKIITPLKDRIGSEIRTHYPADRRAGHRDHRAGSLDEAARRRSKSASPTYMREMIEQMAFLAREDKRIDKRSGVIAAAADLGASRTWSPTRSGAPCEPAKTVAVPRVLDVYAALPSITGKMELEYEGELKGGDAVARELIRTAVGKVYIAISKASTVARSCSGSKWAAASKLEKRRAPPTMVASSDGIQGLMEKIGELGLGANEPDAVRASAGEFILEGLYAHRRISRSRRARFHAGERQTRAGAKHAREADGRVAPVQLVSSEVAPMKWIKYSQIHRRGLRHQRRRSDAALSDFFLQSGFETRTCSSAR